MPIPKKKSNESKKQFIQRCMLTPLMVKEYPNIEQRTAICYKQTKNEK